MPKSTLHRSIYSAATLVWVINFILIFNNSSFSAKKTPTLRITTFPKIVKIYLNGDLYKNKYVATPVEVIRSKQTTSIKISRMGYKSLNYNVSKNLAAINSKLEQKANNVFSKIVIKSNFKKKIHISLNNGLWRGEIPNTLSDILPLSRHNVLTFYPNWPKKSGKFRCKFNITKKNIKPKQKTIIVKKQENSTYKTIGCK